MSAPAAQLAEPELAAADLDGALARVVESA
jgi:hypothetical protein